MWKSWFFVFCFLFFSCASDDETNFEEGGGVQQVAQVMSGIDEFGADNNGTISMIRPMGVPQMNPGWLEAVYNLWNAGTNLGTNEAYAQAGLCFILASFSSCSDNVKVRTYDDCSIGVATYNGNVTLTYDDASENNICLVSSSGHSIARSPSLQVEGLLGNSWSISRTGSTGQQITLNGSDAFTFSSDGIRRAKVDSTGTTTQDHTTQTTEDLVFTGAARDGRVLSSGTIQITDNLNSVVCNFSPSAVTWDSTCTCATSGSWSGTCSDGDTVTLNITGCGTASYTEGSNATTVTLEGCDND